MGIAASATLRTDFVDAVSRTREGLAQRGFGVLTAIGMKAARKAGVGHDIVDHLILGACKPPLAHHALCTDRQLGLPLPCHVVVRAGPADDTSVSVEAMNPQLLVEVTAAPALRGIADDVTARPPAAIDSLGS